MPDPSTGKKDFWDILTALGPAIIAAVVAVLGIKYNDQQASNARLYNIQQAAIARSSGTRQVYTNIMAQRETSDNSIRATMFAMLFKGMFGEDLVGNQSKKGADGISTIKHRIMFIDLMSRNFDTIDIKPLFQDLDHELTKKLYDTSISAQQLGDLFAMRRELRRIGRNLSIRQLNALASLPGSEVSRYVVDLKSATGELHAMPAEIPLSDSNGTSLPLEIKPDGISDGVVGLTLDYRKGSTSESSFKPPSFDLTFYDLPYIDNKVIDKDMRLGVVLSKYFEIGDLDRFRDRLDRHDIKDIEDLKEDGISHYAEFCVIRFPAKYIGNRDRPYIQDIIQALLEEQTEENIVKAAAAN
jgi:hypothetical protein